MCGSFQRLAFAPGRASAQESLLPDVASCCGLLRNSKRDVCEKRKHYDPDFKKSGKVLPVTFSLL